MGGGPESPIIVKEEHDDIKRNDLAIDAITINSDASDNEASAPAILESEKRQLMRELKALGVDIKKVKPDYTKPLNEPSWGGEEDDEDEEYEYEEPLDDGEVLEYEEMELGELGDEEEDEEDVEMKY